MLYSPGITKNLISIEFLANKDFSLEFMRDECTITDPKGCFVGSAYKSPVNGLYKLKDHTLVGCHEIIDSTPQLYSITPYSLL